MRFILFLFLIISAVLAIMQGWIVFAFGFIVVVSMKYSAAVLIPFGILLDGYYGSFAHVPVFSLLAIGWFILVESIRPRLLVNTEHYG